MGWFFFGGGKKKNSADVSPKKPLGEQTNSGGGVGGKEVGGAAADDGQEHGVAGKGYVETKQGKFGRKKVIETNLGPDGKPVYTGYQLEQAMQKMKSKKTHKAREQAKKEEKAYVEYRKAEILRNFQPKVGTLRLGDEAYPKRRRIGMGFGERKAHFLAIRPKAKYATWIGIRKKTIIEVRAQPKANAASAAVITDHSMLPDHSLRTHAKADDKEEQSRKDHETKDKTEIEKPPGGTAAGADEKEAGAAAKASADGATAKPAASEKKKEATSSIKNEKKEKVSKTPAKRPAYQVIENHHHENPFKEDGKTPLWCNIEPEDMGDEDLPVDMDILEKVCCGEKVFCQRPFNKVEFFPYGPIATMKVDDALFVKDSTLFANTVESFISLQPEDDKKKNLPPSIQDKIQWSDKVRVKMFHPALRKPHILEKSWVEQFHMVTRDGKK